MHRNEGSLTQQDIHNIDLRVDKRFIEMSYVANRSEFNGFKQTSGIGGREGIFGIPPLAENFSKIPPWRF